MFVFPLDMHFFLFAAYIRKKEGQSDAGDFLLARAILLKMMRDLLRDLF
jgi:hypothetical protein